MDDSNLETFFTSMKVKKLTRAEEYELSKRIQRGDKAAKDKLVESYLPLVISLSKHYLHRGLDQEDLIQEGTLGLIRAAEKYDWQQGNRFYALAEPWIKQALQRAIDNKAKAIRVPVHQEAKLRKISKAERDLTASNEYEPSIQEIADAAELEVEEVIFLQDKAQPVTSLNTPIGDFETSELGDLIPDERPDSELEAIFGGSVPLHVLTDRERQVINLRYGLDSYPRTLEEVGEELGVTRERIRQIEQGALKKLKEAMEAA